MSHHHSGFFSQGRVIGGLVIIITGVLLLLNNLGTLDIGKFISDYWPILLILLGIRLVFRSSARHDIQSLVLKDPVITTDADRTYYSNTFGDLDVSLKSLDYQSGRISTVFGDLELDLSELRITSGEKDMQMSGVFGDLKVTMPKHVPFYLKASIAAGDIKLLGDRYSGLSIKKAYKSPGYDSATDRLNIDISHVFGDIKVS